MVFGLFLQKKKLLTVELPDFMEAEVTTFWVIECMYTSQLHTLPWYIKIFTSRSLKFRNAILFLNCFTWKIKALRLSEIFGGHQPSPYHIPENLNLENFFIFFPSVVQYSAPFDLFHLIALMKNFFWIALFSNALIHATFPVSILLDLSEVKMFLYALLKYCKSGECASINCNVMETLWPSFM